MKKSLLLLLYVTNCLISFAQHIQYRDKRILQSTATPAVQQPILINSASVSTHVDSVKTVAKIVEKPKELLVVSKPVIKEKDTSDVLKAMSFSRGGENTGNIERVKKKMPELITGCKLSADPDKVAQLPIVINDVSPEMIAKLKQRYRGRLYSVTGLNMLDARLKLKLKICDKDGGKFRIEYLNEDGDIVNDPNLDYYEF